MGNLVEGTEPTLWVLLLASVVIVAVVSFGAGMATRDVRHYRRRLRATREPEPTGDQRIAAATTVDGYGYGRAPVAGQQPIPVAGLELPTRAGVVFPESGVAAVTDGPVMPVRPPRAEDLGELAAAERMDPQAARATTAAMERSVGWVDAALADVRRQAPTLVTDPEDLAETDYDRPVDDDPDNPWRSTETGASVQPQRDRDDDPPAGGAGVAATAVMPPMHRHAFGSRDPWVPTRWVPPPGPMLATAGRRTVAYLQAPIRVWRASAAAGLLGSLRADLDQAVADATATWERQPWRRPAAGGRHRADHRRVA